MSQLNDVLGAILRDIAQARVTSDLFSRQVSELYERDALLRLFPVPRSEIQEVELDLRFAVAGMSADAKNPAELAARVSALYDRFAEALAPQVMLALRGVDELKGSADWNALLQAAEADGAPLQLGKRVLETLELNTGKLVKLSETSKGVSVAIDRNQVVAYAQEAVQTVLYARPALTSFAAKFKSPFAAAKRSVTMALKDQAAVLAAAVGAVSWSEDFRIEVDVTADKLQSLPEAALAVIRVKAGVRNYAWSQVEEKDNQIVRKLVPE